MNRDKAQIARIIARLHRQDLIIKESSQAIDVRFSYSE
ncbi:hypothetical protein JCM19239_4876 [Vibrio variabilis]|uniref:Uncharacterized protein n=1 Tax=Vibrio variabilis TaxID=990271 RepID=A0ABQ0JI67_9VIBR|nr:hypothetical protein JCM19239_4876 [Vibrio variabilis]